MVASLVKIRWRRLWPSSLYSESISCELLVKLTCVDWASSPRRLAATLIAMVHPTDNSRHELSHSGPSFSSRRTIGSIMLGAVLCFHISTHDIIQCLRHRGDDIESGVLCTVLYCTYINSWDKLSRSVPSLELEIDNQEEYYVACCIARAHGAGEQDERRDARPRHPRRMGRRVLPRSPASVACTVPHGCDNWKSIVHMLQDKNFGMSDFLKQSLKLWLVLPHSCDNWKQIVHILQDKKFEMSNFWKSSLKLWLVLFE